MRDEGVKGYISRVRVVSKTSERLICFLIKSVIVKHAYVIITLRKGRKCYLELGLKMKK